MIPFYSAIHFGLYSLLAVSLAVNALMLLLGAYRIHRRGGIKQLGLPFINRAPPQTHISVRSNLYRGSDLAGHVVRPVVMFGDSLTGAGLWPEWYGPPVINRGIGGETTADALIRVHDIVALQPSKVFILFGVNDHGLFIEAVESNMRKIVTELQEGSPGTDIYLQSILPPATMDRTPWILQVNEAFRRLAEEKHIHWVDLYGLFVDGELIDKKLTLDGVHLTVEGYGVWRKAIERNLPAPGFPVIASSDRNKPPPERPSYKDMYK